jgi:very-short-patch-repair endonuclease
LGHLLSVLPGLVLLGEVDALRCERAASIIAALDWCRRHGAAVVALLAEEPAREAPWDFLLHGPVIFEQAPAEPAARRLISALSDVTSRGSAIERRMREALRAAPDLTGLFEDEVIVQLDVLGFTPRVDLLWREGKVVVELDGAEHERDPNYGADRHRDYELLVAGYLVLRLTNAEVELDLGRSLEKVRRVVNMRKGRS